MSPADSNHFGSPGLDHEFPSARLLWCLLPQTLVFILSARISENRTLDELSHDLMVAAMLSQGVIVACWIITWPGNWAEQFVLSLIWIAINYGIMRSGLAAASDSKVNFFTTAMLICLFVPTIAFGAARWLLKLRLSKSDLIVLPYFRFGIRHLLIAMTIVAVGTALMIFDWTFNWWSTLVANLLLFCGIIPSSLAPLITNQRQFLVLGIVAAVLLAVSTSAIATCLMSQGSFRFDDRQLHEITQSVLASLQTLLSTYLLRSVGYRLTMKSLT